MNYVLECSGAVRPGETGMALIRVVLVLALLVSCHAISLERKQQKLSQLSTEAEETALLETETKFVDPFTANAILITIFTCAQFAVEQYAEHRVTKLEAAGDAEIEKMDRWMSGLAEKYSLVSTEIKESFARGLIQDSDVESTALWNAALDTLSKSLGSTTSGKQFHTEAFAAPEVEQKRNETLWFETYHRINTWQEGLQTKLYKTAERVSNTSTTIARKAFHGYEEFSEVMEDYPALDLILQKALGVGSRVLFRQIGADSTVSSDSGPSQVEKATEIAELAGGGIVEEGQDIALEHGTHLLDLGISKGVEGALHETVSVSTGSLIPFLGSMYSGIKLAMAVQSSVQQVGDAWRQTEHLRKQRESYARDGEYMFCQNVLLFWKLASAVDAPEGQMSIDSAQRRLVALLEMFWDDTCTQFEFHPREQLHALQNSWFSKSKCKSKLFETMHHEKGFTDVRAVFGTAESNDGAKRPLPVSTAEMTFEDFEAEGWLVLRDGNALPLDVNSPRSVSIFSRISNLVTYRDDITGMIQKSVPIYLVFRRCDESGGCKGSDLIDDIMIAPSNPDVTEFANSHGYHALKYWESRDSKVLEDELGISATAGESDPPVNLNLGQFESVPLNMFFRKGGGLPVTSAVAVPLKYYRGATACGLDRTDLPFQIGLSSIPRSSLNYLWFKKQEPNPLRLPSGLYRSESKFKSPPKMFIDQAQIDEYTANNDPEVARCVAATATALQSIDEHLRKWYNVFKVAPEDCSDRLPRMLTRSQQLGSKWLDSYVRAGTDPTKLNDLVLQISSSGSLGALDDETVSACSGEIIEHSDWCDLTNGLTLTSSKRAAKCRVCSDVLSKYLTGGEDRGPAQCPTKSPPLNRLTGGAESKYPKYCSSFVGVEGPVETMHFPIIDPDIVDRYPGEVSQKLCRGMGCCPAGDAVVPPWVQELTDTTREKINELTSQARELCRDNIRWYHQRKPNRAGLKTKLRQLEESFKSFEGEMHIVERYVQSAMFGVQKSFADYLEKERTSGSWDNNFVTWFHDNVQGTLGDYVRYVREVYQRVTAVANTIATYTAQEHWVDLDMDGASLKSAIRNATEAGDLWASKLKMFGRATQDFTRTARMTFPSPSTAAIESDMYLHVENTLMKDEYRPVRVSLGHSHVEIVETETVLKSSYKLDYEKIASAELVKDSNHNLLFCAKISLRSSFFDFGASSFSICSQEALRASLWVDSVEQLRTTVPERKKFWELDVPRQFRNLVERRFGKIIAKADALSEHPFIDGVDEIVEWVVSTFGEHKRPTMMRSAAFPRQTVLTLDFQDIE